MVDKLHEYEGTTGRLHGIRDSLKERWESWKSWKEGIPTDQGLEGFFAYLRGPPKTERSIEDYGHVYRPKTRWELIRVSAAVMGIEFSYAAETAFVSPTLLKIGVDHQHMTLVWALSPLVGFFVTPILGSVSDRCRLKQGRRRPFILLLAIGVFFGLILVPNGEDLGYAFGDRPSNFTAMVGHRTSVKSSRSETQPPSESTHPWGIFFTILGTVLLDFDADACQSPARAYLLDVTLPEDHARGLSTFTIMAGLGGFMGYGLGGVDWDATALGQMLGGHLHATFKIITVIFVLCVASTLASFKEVPLEVLESAEGRYQHQISMEVRRKPSERERIGEDSVSYGALGSEPEIADEKGEEIAMRSVGNERNDKSKRGAVPMVPEVPAPRQLGPDGLEVDEVDPKATLQQYLYSIVYMPHSIRMVCLTNLFCWMAHVCYSLYFTDFVGEAVFGGDPKAPEGSKERELYERGVRFGCWGMSMYSLSCSCYSMVIERLIQRYKAKRVYVCGLLFYSSGMMLMALSKHPAGVILFSWTAGVMYSTLFTMPYLLIAHYHATSTFSENLAGEEASQEAAVRGLGTDVAIVSSMVFLAQFLLSCGLGTIVTWSGTTTAVVCVASTLAACGALAATQVMYLDL